MQTILVVDDRGDVANSVTAGLQSLGYAAESACGGAEGLCLLRDRGPYDLIVLDLNMPDVAGTRIIAELPVNAPPVVIMTGDPECVPMPLPDIVKHVLLKPFNLTDLRAAVEDTLGRV